jgi:hypothetical protein
MNRCSAFFALLASLSVTVVAGAQDLDADTRARVHFQRGQELVAEGKCDRAIEQFRSGYELSERPLFLFNIAECQRTAGDLGAAQGTYERYLKEDPSGSMADTARTRLTEVKGERRRNRQSAEDEPSDEGNDEGNGESKAASASASGSSQPEASPAVVPSPEQAARESSSSDGGMRLTTGAPQTDRGTDAPIYKRWPFWVGIGAAVAAAVVVPVVVTQTGGNDGPSCGSGCEVVDFRNALTSW